MIPAMKITAIDTFVVNTGFKPPRPWHFCAIRTDEGLTGYSEFGSEGLTRGLSNAEAEQLFALGFALEQMHRDCADLERCLQELARPSPPDRTGQG